MSSIRRQTACRTLWNKLFHFPGSAYKIAVEHALRRQYLIPKFQRTDLDNLSLYTETSAYPPSALPAYPPSARFASARGVPEGRDSHVLVGQDHGDISHIFSVEWYV